MKPIPVTQKLSVAAQLQPDDFQELSRLGFKTVINNRPDGEEASQPGTDAEAAAAKAAGLDYVFIPVTSSSMTDSDVRRFAEAIVASDGPVLAHCRSGARSFYMWVLAGDVDVQGFSDDKLVAVASNIGIAPDASRAWLATHRRTGKPDVKGFYDSRTGSIQYVVSDPTTKRCAIIDPVLDYDEKSATTKTEHADEILGYVTDEGLTVEWILDTHPHADHFSAARYLKEKTGAPTAIGAHVVDVQALWKDIYNWPDFPADGSQWDRLFNEGDTFKVGTIDARVMFSPGHTLASITYVIGEAAFVHDTLFVPDSGTARADFPGGSARVLWKSIQDILALPDQTRIFTGHDYQPGGRKALWESTVAVQKHSNPHIAGQTEESFVALREARDATLPMPKLILHALQVNINGGRLPEPESNGRRYLKIPLDALEGAAW
ncbi:bifunctional sulfur transferase/dioxygenase Blh [Aquamicrobium sp. NLF2-7]|uniref:bifunctional sulfur transferase/dioxygenase Blh n=1 Tax=Aquamicrobium sp. NLF2-7 TaxID=2918753 RepID=UPI001EFBBD48|nr:bifunctional sulfur transferase/dioxygenase Blh [Aquamicrobium sp. NLF2-7]MCG8274708.1 bifunctional sulfur transferase/dioxygenase Blh [Aquamicrobium sp. NLF2-7]